MNHRYIYIIVFKVAALTYLLCITLISCEKSPVSALGIQERIALSFGGYDRNYIIYVPAQLEARPAVIIQLHGGGGTAAGAIDVSKGRFNELAERDGFIVVYPNAIDKVWNDGRRSEFSTAYLEGVDDVGFIVQILEDLRERYDIDVDRTYATGMSNGGFMTTRLLCDRADRFRGGAIVTATISEDYLPDCMPSQPVGVIVFNGTADEIVPYDGGVIRVFNMERGLIISTRDFASFWRDRNQCSLDTEIVQLTDAIDDNTTVSVEIYNGCSVGGAVEVYTIYGGGHTWPGGKQYLPEAIIGKTSREIVACDVIWDFFKKL